MSDNGKPDLFTTEQQQLGSVYAKALLGVGEKSGNTSQLLEELSAVAEAVSNQPSLNSTLQSPQVGAEEKLNLVGKIFEKKVSASMLNFLKVIVGKDRFDCVPAISAAAKKINDDNSGEIQATVTTAEEVSAAAQEEIAKQLSKKLGKKVKLDSVIDRQLLAESSCESAIRFTTTVSWASYSRFASKPWKKPLKRSEKNSIASQVSPKRS